MDILLLLFLLQIKHWYADFKIQTYQQTVKKGVWLDPIGLSHSVDHVFCTLIALLFFHFIYPLSGLAILTVALIEGILHYIIDYIKVKYGCKDNTKPLFWNQFGLDQLAHQATYLGIAFILLV
jgi:Protein of unknown function (DUF3307)